MGFLRTIADAVYHEYDRRIKRASLITEYGAAQHHADAGHAAEEEEEEAEIVNVPLGTVLGATPTPPAHE